MSFSRLFIRRPVAANLLAFALVLAGAIGYSQLSVAPLPEVDYPVIEVSANLPGASPETMASSVATPLERALASTPGVIEIYSSSSQGSTSVELVFSLDRDLNDAARDVQAAINTARPMLPSALPGLPTYKKINPSQAPVIALALTSPTLSPGQLYDQAATLLAQKIAQIPGVGEVRLGGGSLPAVRVQLDPNALNQYGILLDDVANAISQANSLRPQGELEQGSRYWQIQANDQLRKAADYRQLMISWRDGAAVKLGDVATLSDGTEDRYSAGFHNDRAAVLLIISRQPGANIIDTVDAIHAQLPVLRSLLPSNIELAVTMDRSPGIRASLSEARKTLAISFSLVIVVVFLALGKLRTTAVAAIVVPVSVIGALAGVYLLGFSLNNLSLMALIVATSLVVDDAIVVIENITRHIDAGASPLRAALRGGREIGSTLLSMNLALITVFLSVLLMGDLVAEIFREFSLTLAVAILLSLLVSLSLTPSLCARLLPARPDRARPHFGQRVFARLEQTYARSLDWSLQHKAIGLVALVLLFGLNAALYPLLPRGVLPKQDTGQLRGFARGDDGLSFEVMQPKIAEYRELLLRDPAVADAIGFIGGDMGINNAYMMIRLKPVSERGISAEQVVQRLRDNMPKIPGGILWLSVDQDIQLDFGGGDGEYELSLQAGEVQTLRQWTPIVSAALEKLPELRSVEKTGDEGARQVRLEIDTDAARRLGVDASMVGSMLNNAFSQRQVATLYDRLNQYHVVMELDPRYTRDPTVLDQVYVIGSQGQRVPLSAFSRYDYGIAPDRINHMGAFASTRVEFTLAPGVSLSQASAAIDKALAEIMLPSEQVIARVAGEGELMRNLDHNRPLLFIGALLVVYALLGVLYESYLHPLTILSTLPSAGVGAFAVLLLLGIEFNLIAMLGLFLLVGLVMKNAILIVDFALNAERREGLLPQQAIHRAALQRLRPIVMTNSAAILGALPLALAFGEGSELRQPLGITIVGGLLFSQLLTLYITPTVYLSLQGLRKRLTQTKPG